eukprot:TRINITY_DN910_c0_g1_i2.p1 TRINITY_DN910_c0_g1~~TRINITY_DN910_c0_g1_i2.p1  ORF type:complete len:276 (-),score=55.79 TRINITY_DN910_c0_g1_i2:105-932(-)
MCIRDRYQRRVHGESINFCQFKAKMVAHLFERIFGTYGRPGRRFQEDLNVETLREQGFTIDEAQGLSWFIHKNNWGKAFGVFSGGLSLYFGRSFFVQLAKMFPRLHFARMYMWGVKSVWFYVFYTLGEYLSVARRTGANDQVSNMYNNNAFTFAKDKFLQNFEVLNRKFTSEEIAQFIDNSYLRTRGPRRWIYNPYVHGGTEEEFYKFTSALESGIPPFSLVSVKQKIREENQEKIFYGEKVQEQPFNIVGNVDRHGYRYGMEYVPLGVGWRPLN